MPVVIGPDGQSHWVDPETAAALRPEVATQAAPVQLTGKRVAMVDDVGQIRELDQAEVPQALAAGWRSETPEEFRARELQTRYGGSELESYAEEFVRSGTAGLSDVVIGETLEAFDPTAAERFRTEARERQEHIGPVGSTIAGLAGAIVSPLSRVGALPSAARAQGIAAAGVQGAKRLAVEGAIQGGIYGAGGALSEAALAPGGNYDDLASKMIAGGVGGGAFGLVTGGMLGFAGGAGLKAAERGAEKLVGPGGLKRILEDVSDSAAARALGVSGTARNESQIQRMAQVVKRTHLDDGTPVFRPSTTNDSLAERVALAKDQAVKRLDRVTREIDDEIESAITSGSYREAPQSMRPDLGKFFAKVDGMVKEADAGPAELAKRMRNAAKQVENLRTAFIAGEATLGSTLKYRRALDKVLYPKKVKGAGVTVQRANAGELSAIRSELEDTIEAAVKKAEPLVPGASAKYLEAKVAVGALRDADGFAQKALTKGDTNNRFSLIESLSGITGTVAGIATGNILPVLGGAALAGGRKLWRARGEQALAIIADRAAKSDLKLDAAVSRYFKRAGDVRRGTIGAFSAQEDKKSRQERVLRQKKNESKADAYQRTLKRISDYNPGNDPDMPALSSAAPQTAMATAARQARAREYLIKTAPTDVIGDDPLQPQLKKKLADPVKLEHWSRRLEAVEDPVGVIQRGLDHGTLTREHVETIKHVDPQLFESLRMKVMDQLATSKKKLPYQQRIRLGVLLNIPTDKSLRPDQIARTQMMFQKLRAQQPQQKPAPSPSPGQPGASPYASESQRLEANIPPQ